MDRHPRRSKRIHRRTNETSRIRREKAEKTETPVYSSPSHYKVIDYNRAKQLGLKVTLYENRIEEWKTMRRWLGKYILEEAEVHHMAYILPEVRK